MKIGLFLLLLSTIGLVNANSCNTNCYMNVDSLFQINLSILKKDVTDSIKNKVIIDKNSIEFLFAASLLSGIDFLDAKNNSTNLKSIMALEVWYLKNKKNITGEKVKKAYLLLKPYLFNNFEDFEIYSKELDQLEIEEK